MRGEHAGAYRSLLAPSTQEDTYLVGVLWERLSASTLAARTPACAEHGRQAAHTELLPNEAMMIRAVGAFFVSLWLCGFV